MTEGEFLKDWVNDTKNEYNEKDHHEYSEREVMDMLRKWKEIKEQELKKKIENDFNKWQEQNNFVHIVEDRKGYEQGYFSTREKAEQRIKEIQSYHREALVINCQKIY